MRTAARFHADDALRRQRVVAHQELRVFLGVDVVRHRGDVVAVAQRAAKRKHERRLARADRSADVDTKGHVPSLMSETASSTGSRAATKAWPVRERNSRTALWAMKFWRTGTEASFALPSAPAARPSPPP